jgi:hypothetical protein
VYSLPRVFRPVGRRCRKQGRDLYAEDVEGVDRVGGLPEGGTASSWAEVVLPGEHAVLRGGGRGHVALRLLRSRRIARGGRDGPLPPPLAVVLGFVSLVRAVLCWGVPCVLHLTDEGGESHNAEKHGKDVAKNAHEEHPEIEIHMLLPPF